MKAKLRSQKLLERLEHDPGEKDQKDLLIIQKLSSLPEFRKARRVLFYMALPGEVDLGQLFKSFQTEKEFVLPRVQKESLALYYIRDLKDLERGTFKISEPKIHLPPAQFSEIDLILVPGIVFSRNGHRIGYGRGFYDRILIQMTALKIGIAYEFQMVNNIQGEVHDVPMDIIVTEKEVVRVKTEHREQS